MPNLTQWSRRKGKGWESLEEIQSQDCHLDDDDVLFLGWNGHQNYSKLLKEKSTARASTFTKDRANIWEHHKHIHSDTGGFNGLGSYKGIVTSPCITA